MAPPIVILSAGGKGSSPLVFRVRPSVVSSTSRDSTTTTTAFAVFGRRTGVGVFKHKKIRVWAVFGGAPNCVWAAIHDHTSNICYYRYMSCRTQVRYAQFFAIGNWKPGPLNCDIGNGMQMSMSTVALSGSWLLRFAILAQPKRTNNDIVVVWRRMKTCPKRTYACGTTRTMARIVPGA